MDSALPLTQAAGMPSGYAMSRAPLDIKQRMVPGPEMIVHVDTQALTYPVPYGEAKSTRGGADRENSMTNQFKKISRAELHRWNLFGKYNFTLGDFAGCFADLTMEPLTRGQVWPAGQAGGNKGWHTTQLFDRTVEQNGDQTLNSFLHYTFFPAVVKHQANERARQMAEVRIIPYCMVYSSFEPDGGLSQNASLLSHHPNWTKVQLRRGALRNQRTTWGADEGYVNLDTMLCGNDSTRYAIIAAIQDLQPASGSYISFFPYVTDRVYGAYHGAQEMTALGPGNPWSVRGASCGLAAAAAIMGLPSIFYTGYLKNIAPNQLLRGLPARHQEMWSYTTDVAAQQNIVEDVQDIAWKVMYCIIAKQPCVFPNMSTLSNQSIEEAITSAGASFLRSTATGIYTTAKANLGLAYLDMKTPLLMAVDLDDVVVLAAYAAIGYHITSAPLMSWLNENMRTIEGTDREMLKEDVREKWQRASDERERVKATISREMTEYKEANKEALEKLDHKQRVARLSQVRKQEKKTESAKKLAAREKASALEKAKRKLAKANAPARLARKAFATQLEQLDATTKRKERPAARKKLRAAAVASGEIPRARKAGAILHDLGLTEHDASYQQQAEEDRAATQKHRTQVMYGTEEERAANKKARKEELKERSKEITQRNAGNRVERQLREGPEFQFGRPVLPDTMLGSEGAGAADAGPEAAGFFDTLKSLGRGALSLAKPLAKKFALEHLSDKRIAGHAAKLARAAAPKARAIVNRLMSDDEAD